MRSSPRNLGLAFFAFLYSTTTAGTAAFAFPQDASRPTPPVVNQSALPSGTPKIVFSGKALPIAEAALAPYRDSDGAVCAAPESLAPLGISYLVDARAGIVSLTGPESTTFSTRIRRSPSGRVFVPVSEVLENLGAKCQWVPGENTLYVRSLIRSVDMWGGQIRIKTAFPVAIKVTNRTDPAQVVVDVLGAERGNLPKSIPIVAMNLNTVRVGQFDDDTVRIVFDLKKAAAFAPPTPQPATLLALNPVPVSPIVIKIPADDPSPAAPGTPSAKPLVTIQPAPVVSALRLVRVDDRKAQLVISAGRIGSGSVRTNMTRDQLTLDLPGVTLGDGADSGLKDFEHPLIGGVSATATGATGVRISVDLKRVVAYSISPATSPAGIVLDLSLPQNAGGLLAGKLVVVDPGHGAHDGGAKGINGAWEKNINLAIGRELRDRLRDAGANVIMTRSDDTFIPLDEKPGTPPSRSGITRRVGADFFVSIHADSTSNRSASGSAVWYHMDESGDRGLALAISARLKDISGMGHRGIRSDRIMYRSGFAVLHGHSAVGVLVECGFVSNPGDAARLIQPAVQKNIAGAIANGLRDYIEGNPTAVASRPSGQDQNTASSRIEMPIMSSTTVSLPSIPAAMPTPR